MKSSPTCIETAARAGYRFIARATSARADDDRATSVATARPVELDELVRRGRFDHLLANEFVAGVYCKLGDLGGS